MTKQATFGKYIIVKRDSGSITIDGVSNVKAKLRDISNKIGFEYDPKWTTRQFGDKLINYINTNNISNNIINNKSVDINKDNNKKNNIISKPKDSISKEEANKMFFNITYEEVIQSSNDFQIIFDEYEEEERCLNKYFQNNIENTNLINVIIKTTILDSFYATRLKMPTKIANHIISIKNVDYLLKNEKINKYDLSKSYIPPSKPLTVVDIISNPPNQYNNFSFATKYCNFHYPGKYIIYDSYIKKFLLRLQKNNFFGSEIKIKYNDSSFRKDYTLFHTVYTKFLEMSKLDKLENFSFKLIDKYIWRSMKTAQASEKEINSRVSNDKEKQNAYNRIINNTINRY